LSRDEEWRFWSVRHGVTDLRPRRTYTPKRLIYNGRMQARFLCFCLGLLLAGCAERPAAVVGKPEPDPEFAAVADAEATFTVTDQTEAAFS